MSTLGIANSCCLVSNYRSDAFIVVILIIYNPSEECVSILTGVTDVARDTSDLEWASSDESAASVLEFEVASSDDDALGEKGSPFVDSHDSSSNEDEDVRKS